MKIAIFTDTFLPQINGVVSACYNQAVELSNLGHEVLIVTSGDKSKKYVLEGKINVFVQYGFILPSYKDYKIVFPRIIKIIKLLKEFKAEVIHVQTPFGIGIEGIIAGKLLKIPIIGTHHTFYSDYVKHIFLIDLKIFRRLNDKYTAFFFNRCNLLTSPSNALLEELKNVGIKREIIRIPNGIILEKYKKKNDLKKSYGHKRNIMYFGRVSYEKSIDKIIYSMQIVQKKYPDVYLFIVGDGPNLEELKKLSLDLGVKTIFAGAKRDQELIDHISSGDIFVTASKSENQPMSILEAMACKRSMVGVNSKGVPELIIHNRNGLIAIPDDIEDIAKKIIIILEDKKLRKKFENESVKIVLDYSTKNIAKKWIEIYNALINKNLTKT